MFAAEMVEQRRARLTRWDRRARFAAEMEEQRIARLKREVSKVCCRNGGELS